MDDKKLPTQETAVDTVSTRTATNQSSAETRQAAADVRTTFRTYYLVYYVAGLLAILLAFRFVLLLLGANSNSGFVSFIYGLTSIFVAPFSGIFPGVASTGVVTTSIFDPSILIAMIVYGLIAWGCAKLLNVITAGRTPKAS